MPNGWSFNRTSTATRERESLETCCLQKLLVVYVCVLALSLIDAKDISSTRKGIMTKWPHHNGKFVELVNHWSGLSGSNYDGICGAQDALHMFGRLQEASTVILVPVQAGLAWCCVGRNGQIRIRELVRKSKGGKQWKLFI